MRKGYLILFIILCLALSGCATQAEGQQPGVVATAPATATAERPAAPTPEKETQMIEKTPEGGQEQPLAGEKTNVPLESLPKAVQAAVEKLSQTLKTPVEEIRTISYEQVQWRNGCLGFSNPNEKCIDVIVPGWRVILEAGEKQYEFHTNENGAQMRYREGVATPAGSK